MGIRGAAGSCKDEANTTLNASDLHNAQAAILNPFYNMEYEIVRINNSYRWRNIYIYIYEQDTNIALYSIAVIVVVNSWSLL